MIFPFAAAVLLTLATLWLALPVMAVLAWRRRPLRPFWRRFLGVHLLLFVVHLGFTFPLLLGLLGSRGLDTKPPERGYAGPRLDAAGVLLVQDEHSLLAERRGERALPPPEVLAAAAAREQRLRTRDQVGLRAFRLEPKVEPPVATCVLVHGLFRCAIELEPVAAMLRDLGCECWLLELRNHGGSERAPFTGGLREREDVLAAVAAARAVPGREATPLVLFGVSLGSLAVSMALPEIEGLAGLVLDAPMADLTEAAHRLMQFRRGGAGRSWLQIDEPWRSMVLLALQQWSDFRAADVSPAVVLSQLPIDLPVLLVGGELDDRAPPQSLQRLLESLPMHPGCKELWLVPGSGHGKAFLDQPSQYSARLAALLSRLRRPQTSFESGR
jgi:alpha-beta hydrolase superfamily lysophospholipase